MTIARFVTTANSVLEYLNRLLPVVIIIVVLAFLPSSTRRISVKWRAIRALDRQIYPAVLSMPPSRWCKLGSYYRLFLMMCPIFVCATAQLDDGQRPIIKVLRVALMLVYPLYILYVSTYSVAVFLSRATGHTDVVVSRSVTKLDRKKVGSSKAHLDVALRYNVGKAWPESLHLYAIATQIFWVVAICISTGHEPLAMLAFSLVCALGTGAGTTFSSPRQHDISAFTGQIDLQGHLFMVSLLYTTGIIFLVDEWSSTIASQHFVYRAAKPGCSFMDAIMADRIIYQLLSLVEVVVWASLAAIPVELCAFIYRFESEVNVESPHEEEEQMKRAIAETKARYGDKLHQDESLVAACDITPISLSSPSLSEPQLSSSKTPVYRATIFSVYLVFLLTLLQHILYLEPLQRERGIILHMVLLPREGDRIMSQFYSPSGLCLCPAVCLCVALAASAWHYGGLRGIRQLWAYNEQWSLRLPVVLQDSLEGGRLVHAGAYDQEIKSKDEEEVAALLGGF